MCMVLIFYIEIVYGNDLIKAKEIFNTDNLLKIMSQCLSRIDFETDQLILTKLHFVSFRNGFVGKQIYI